MYQQVNRIDDKQLKLGDIIHMSDWGSSDQCRMTTTLGGHHTHGGLWLIKLTSKNNYWGHQATVERQLQGAIRPTDERPTTGVMGGGN